jgi:hypothetical protein
MDSPMTRVIHFSELMVGGFGWRRDLRRLGV